jgi:hypothetical protein
MQKDDYEERKRRQEENLARMEAEKQRKLQEKEVQQRDIVYCYRDFGYKFKKTFLILEVAYLNSLHEAVLPFYL